MTEEGALLAAIREHPGEDTPRLAYADWLDERPTPKRRARAESIRVQVEEDGLRRTRGWLPDEELLARDPHAAQMLFEINNAERESKLKAIRRRETALLKTWGMSWLPRPGRRLSMFGNTVGPDAGMIGDVSKFSVTGRTIATGFAVNLAYTFARGFVADALVVWIIPPRTTDTWAHPYVEHLKPLLAAHPVEHVAFRFEGCVPKLSVRVNRDHRSGWWYATLDADEQGASSDAYETRRELVGAGLGAFLSRQLQHVKFRHVEPAIPF